MTRIAAIMAGMAPRATAKVGSTRMFATTVPGLAPIVRRALDDFHGVTVHDSGSDGRSDVVVFDVPRGKRTSVLDLGLTEDVFVEVGRTLRSDGDNASWIARRIWRPERVQRALSVWADHVRPLAGVMTFRVIARVLQAALTDDPERSAQVAVR